MLISLTLAVACARSNDIKSKGTSDHVTTGTPGKGDGSDPTAAKSKDDKGSQSGHARTAQPPVERRPETPSNPAFDNEGPAATAGSSSNNAATAAAAQSSATQTEKTEDSEAKALQTAEFVGLAKRLYLQRELNLKNAANFPMTASLEKVDLKACKSMKEEILKGPKNALTEEVSKFEICWGNAGQYKVAKQVYLSSHHLMIQEKPGLMELYGLLRSAEKKALVSRDYEVLMDSNNAISGYRKTDVLAETEEKLVRMYQSPTRLATQKFTTEIKSGEMQVETVIEETTGLYKYKSVLHGKGSSPISGNIYFSHVLGDDKQWLLEMEAQIVQGKQQCQIQVFEKGRKIFDNSATDCFTIGNSEQN